VEILFPVLDPEVKEKVRHILDVQLADTKKARELNADNNYERIDRRGKNIIGAQETFCKEAIRDAKAPKTHMTGRTFTPAMPPEEE